APGLRARLVRGSPQRVEDLLLAPSAESGQPAQALLLRSGAQVDEGRDAELLPDPPRGLRAEPGQAHEEDDLRRDDRLPLRQRVDLAVVGDLDDLLLDRLADSLELFRPAGAGELHDRAGRLADPVRGSPVRDDPE